MRARHTAAVAGERPRAARGRDDLLQRVRAPQARPCDLPRSDHAARRGPGGLPLPRRRGLRRADRRRRARDDRGREPADPRVVAAEQLRPEGEDWDGAWVPDLRDLLAYV